MPKKKKKGASQWTGYNQTEIDQYEAQFGPPKEQKRNPKKK